MSKKYSLFIGRFQPFHNGHAFIIQQALDKGRNALIAVRDTPISAGDPYTVAERIEMIEKHYADLVKKGVVKVMMIPDIESVNIGRKVGYEVIRYDAPTNIEGISATGIRKSMNEGDVSWEERVPEGVAEWFKEKAEKTGKVVWMTGPSGTGKTTIAQSLAARLRSQGQNVKILDGDELRKGISNNLGLSPEDRAEHNRRVAHLAKAITEVGGTAIVALISPYKATRDAARDIIGDEKFRVLHLYSTQEDRIERDPKGLYAKAIAGEIKGLTGYDGEYEEPEMEELAVTVNTSTHDVNACVDMILDEMF
jgi:adenylylsulfate kinase